VILRGHNVDLIEQVESIDLLITDPPYALGGCGQEHELTASVAVALREYAKKLKTGSWAIVFAASSYRSTVYMIEALRGVLEPVRFGTWVKPASRTKVRSPGWEWASVNIIAFRKGPKNRDDLKNMKPVGLDYISCPPVKNGRRAELPLEAARWAVEPFVIEGGIAFDPFAGSGALLKAAEEFGMKTIGIEKQEK
jgi:DNA modification methylase